MKKLLLSISLFFCVSVAYADVHKFTGSDGSALLTNRKPQIRKDILPATATVKDLIPNASSSKNDGIEYTYQGSQKIVPTVETVHLGARDVYKQGWCKMNNMIVPCYGYERTLPATSFKVDSTKTIDINPNTVLRESIEDAK
ncbi:hypothetical protein [Acinetobacter tandoii]